MEFDEVVGKIKSRVYANKFKNIFAGIGEMYNVFPVCIDDIIENMDKTDSEMGVVHKENFYTDLSSVLRNIREHLIMGKLGHLELDFINLLLDVVGNWFKIKKYNQSVGALTTVYRNCVVLASNKRTMDETVTVIQLLLFKVRNIMDNEPYISKVSGMYTTRLKEYFEWKEENPKSGSRDTDDLVYEKEILDVENKDPEKG